MIARGSACGRHRDALAALAERRQRSPDGQAALEHVERCRDCSEALGELILTVFALRRLGSEAALATPAPGARQDDDWTRLRVRIDRSRRLAQEQAWRWRASLGGLAAASLLVAAVVSPATIHVTASSDSGPAAVTSIERDRLAGGGSAGASLALERLEQESLRAERRTFDPMAVPDGEPSGAVPRVTIHPDEIRPVWKEVPAGELDAAIPTPARVVPAI